MDFGTLKTNLTRGGFINGEDLLFGALGFVMAGPLGAVGVGMAGPVGAVLSPLVNRVSGGKLETWAVTGMACFALTVGSAVVVQNYNTNVVETTPVVQVAETL